MMKRCALCNRTFETVKYGGKRIYCFECNPRNSAKSITIIRRKARDIAIDKLGGKCKKCGNNKQYLLEFHHRNPNEKDGGISEFAKRYDLGKFFEEIDKCDLLCCNCHKEFHYLNDHNGLNYEKYIGSR